MGLGARITDWIALAFVVAILYVLVRPKSKAGELIDAVVSFVEAIARSAADLAAAPG